MTDAEKLKKLRDLLLKLHKAMLDRERELYEAIHGHLSATGFLNVLLENEDFGWLRKFSMLIVEIDEMFAQKDGIAAEAIAANLDKVKELVEMTDPDEYFREKYREAIQNDPASASFQSELKLHL